MSTAVASKVGAGGGDSGPGSMLRSLLHGISAGRFFLSTFLQTVTVTFLIPCCSKPNFVVACLLPWGHTHLLIAVGTQPPARLPYGHSQLPACRFPQPIPQTFGGHRPRNVPLRHHTTQSLPQERTQNNTSPFGRAIRGSFPLILPHLGPTNGCCTLGQRMDVAGFVVQLLMSPYDTALTRVMTTKYCASSSDDSGGARSDSAPGLLRMVRTSVGLTQTWAI
jgi:hypothetical protein